MNERKTLEEHRDYLYQIVKLKLFFLWNWKHERPEESLSYILRERVNIYRKTAVNTGLRNPDVLHYDSAGWLELEHRLDDAYKKYNDNESAFEDAGFMIFKNSIDARTERDYLDTSGTAGYQCGSLRYNEYTDGLTHEFADFHIANTLQPASIFDDPQYLPECFIELMRQTEEKYGCTRLATSTWLNSVSKWLELFPHEWHENLKPPQTDVKWHHGFWGQFITARGTFNCKYGRMMRETGRLPFYPRASQCSFESMKKHLKEKYNIG